MEEKASSANEAAASDPRVFEKKAKTRRALNKASKDTALLSNFDDVLINERMAKKPQFQITDEGVFRDSIVHFQSLSTTSSLIGKLIGRSNQNVEMAHNKFCETTDVAMDGYLTKQGSWFHSWKRRFFVLRKDLPLLNYYSSEGAKDQLLGTLQLSSETTVEKVTKSNASDNDFAFQITTPASTIKHENGDSNTTPEATLLVYADSEEEVDSWIFEIMLQARMSGNRKGTENENAEINWWDAIFAGKEIRHAKSSRRRKGVVSKSGNDECEDTTKDPDPDQKELDKMMNAQLSSVLDSRAAGTTEEDVSSDEEDLYSEEDESDDIVGEKGEKASSSKPQGSREGREKKKNTLVTFERMNKKKVKKVKKEKKAQEPPMAFSGLKGFTYTVGEDKDKDNNKKGGNGFEGDNTDINPINNNSSSSSHSSIHSTNTALEGVQLCLELRHMCYEGDSIFAVICGFSDGMHGGENKIVELCRTETITITDTADYALSLARCHLHFSLMQFNIPEIIQDLYISINREEKGKHDPSFVPLTEAICQVRFTRKMFEQNRIFCSKMKIVGSAKHSVDLTNPQLVEGNAKIGVIRLKSTNLYNAITSFKQTFPVKPYSEVLYSFKTTTGSLMSVEQIFASPYSVKVSKSFIKLLLREREPVVSGMYVGLPLNFKTL